MPCSLVNGHQCFRKTCFLHLQSRRPTRWRPQIPLKCSYLSAEDYNVYVHCFVMLQLYYSIQYLRLMCFWILQVNEEQVVMAHSPLRMFQQYHNKCVLISGQGPIAEIAKNIGFKKIITIDQMRNTFPMLDAVDHKRRISVVSAIIVKVVNNCL